MKTWFALIPLLTSVLGLAAETNSVPEESSMEPASAKKVYILPIRDNIDRPILYVVRRGIKEAMEAKADLLVLNMETNGGSGAVMEKIIEALSIFEDETGGETVTYVNKKAFSAGALIAIATQKIYMAPESVIGAAAPVMMTPMGGINDMPSTMEAKAVSAISAMIRAQAQKHGHDPRLVEAMMNIGKEVKIDGEVLAEEGEVLTLTNVEAEKEYGDPPKPLLSAGTVKNMDALLATLGYANAQRVEVVHTGAENIASWINSISAILLIIGIIGLYLEFKTPGFGLPGIVGIIAFVLYFTGSHIAGLSGMEWLALFLLGVLLVAVELFLIPGTIIVGILGTGLMLVALLMAMVDHYPGTPPVPSIPDLREPMQNLGIALIVALVLVLILARFLPKTSLYSILVSQSQSGMESLSVAAEKQKSLIGREGIAISLLRPSGKAQFGDDLLDVVTEGEILEKGKAVRIIGFHGSSAVVEEIV